MFLKNNKIMYHKQNKLAAQTNNIHPRKKNNFNMK